MRASFLKPAASRLARQVSRSPGLFSALLACVLIFATFPDVFLAGTSLRNTDQLWGSYQNLALYRVHPLTSATDGPLRAEYGEWLLAYNDMGGAVWQSEPMMEFMRHTIWTLDSPYWNPYSSAGSLGPETLVDLKLSILTIAYAVLGGGTFVYNILLLAFFWIGTYFVTLIAREKLQLSAFGSTAAGIFYLLNGFSAGNVGSNVAQSYLLIPFCLYTSFSFTDRPGLTTFARLAFAFGALMSFTFLPTTIVATLAILGCGVGYMISTHWRDSRIVRVALITLIGHSLAILAALALLAVIYLPFVESLSTTGLLGLYTQRILYPAFWTSALSLLTPSHFFNSSLQFMEPDAVKVAGNTIYHFGVVGLILAACAWSARPSRWQPLVCVCAAVIVVAVGRIFDVPVISGFVALIPVVRNLGDQYLWVAVVVPLGLLVALGADNLLNGTVSRIPATTVLAAGVAAGLTLAMTYGLREPNVFGKVVALTTVLLLGLIAAAAVWIAPRASAAQRSVIAGAILGLLFIELAVDARWLRFQANDSFSHPTSEVGFLQAHIGDYRTMTLGAYATTMDRGGAYQLAEITSLNEETLPGYHEYFENMIRNLPQKYRMGDFVSLAYPQDASSLDYYDWTSIDLLGVKYIIIPKTSPEYLAAFERNHFTRVHDSQFTVVFENPGVMPRAFAIDLGVRSDGDQTLPSDVKDRITPATIAEYRNAHVEITGTADRVRMVVLTDNWHENWRALVNGAPSPIQRVNGTFRGVWVPAGEFKVEMFYEPRTLPAAVVISLLATSTLLALLTVPGWGFLHRRAVPI